VRRQANAFCYRRYSSVNLAAALLLVGVTRHYGWDLLDDPSQRALMSKALGGAASLYLLLTVYSLAPVSGWLTAVTLWWAWEDVQIVLCSLAYMRWPWHVDPGQPLCSAAVGFDIGAATIVGIAFLAYRLQAVRSDR
jgi:hypothetical protein